MSLANVQIEREKINKEDAVGEEEKKSSKDNWSVNAHHRAVEARVRRWRGDNYTKKDLYLVQGGWRHNRGASIDALSS